MEVPQLPLSPTTYDFLNQVLIAASNFAVDRQHILRVEVGDAKDYLVKLLGAFVLAQLVLEAWDTVNIFVLTKAWATGPFVLPEFYFIH